MLRGGKRHLEWKRPAWYVFYSFVNTLHRTCFKNTWVILMKGWHTDWVTRAVFISSAFTIKDQQVQVTPCVILVPLQMLPSLFRTKPCFEFSHFRDDCNPLAPMRLSRFRFIVKICVLIDLWDHNRGDADSFKFLQSTTLILITQPFATLT